MLPVLFSSSAQRNVWLVCRDVMSICGRKRRVFSTYIFHLTLPHNIPGAANIHSNMKIHNEYIFGYININGPRTYLRSQYVYHYEDLLLLSICMMVVLGYFSTYVYENIPFIMKMSGKFLCFPFFSPFRYFTWGYVLISILWCHLLNKMNLRNKHNNWIYLNGQNVI